MPLIVPGPGEAWCPCCERLFARAPGVRRTFCSRPDCVPSQKAWSQARHASLGGCPDCGGRRGNHDERRCTYGILEKLGVPDGLCPWCGAPVGGYPNGGHLPGCQLKRYASQDGKCRICGRPLDPRLAYPDPDSVNREHRVAREHGGGKLGYDNVELAHTRCNTWRGSADASGVQPPWGVRPGLRKVERRSEFPGRTSRS